MVYQIIMDDLVTGEQWTADRFNSVTEALEFIRSLLIEETWEDKEEYKEWLQDNDYDEEEHPMEEFVAEVTRDLDVEIDHYLRSGMHRRTGIVWKTQQYTIIKQ